MLITLQSHKEVLDFISKSSTSHSPSHHHVEGQEQCTSDHTPRTPILSISPQTLASLSAHYSALTGKPYIPLRTLLRRIRRFLGEKERGAWRVWDTTFARHLSLQESIKEFDERRAWRDKGKAKATIDNLTDTDGNRVPAPGPLPMLASACPGWVCYAEKAQGDLLPMMAAARSSQAIMGALVKDWLAKKMGLSPDKIYHVTAMPCYDKKLEASRSDFYSSVYSTRDVDCVLTTGELDLLLSDLGFDPYVSIANEEDQPSTNIEDVSACLWPEMLNHAGSSSGSYLGTLLTALASRHPNPTRVIVKEIRGSTDNVEYWLEDVQTHEVLFKGSKCYGFRNLQNLVRKVGKETGLVKGGNKAGASKLSAAIAARRRNKKAGVNGTSGATTPGTPGTPGTSGASGTQGSDAEGIAGVLGREEKKLDFVEVMACPGGCVNGGGQMKPAAPTSGSNADGNAANGTTPDERTKNGMEIDEEGYPRPMADDGTAPAPPAVAGGEEGMRWSTKEWVAKVETIYWTGLPTPPLSPKSAPEGLNGDIDIATKDHTSRGADEDRLGMADEIAANILGEAVGDEVERWEFLRTRYRKVEGDVLQGGVTHEAVVW